MNIAKKLAGYTLGQADALRKLIAKKKLDELPAARAQFVQGGVANGYPEELMNQLFDQIEKFGGLTEQPPCGAIRTCKPGEFRGSLRWSP